MVYQTGIDYRSTQPPDLRPSSATGIQKVVMLTNFIENNRQKCEKYFPMELDEEVIIHNPDNVEESKFLVKNCGMLKKSGYTIRKLDVRFVKVETEEVNAKRTDRVELEGDVNIDTLETKDNGGLSVQVTEKKVDEINRTHERSFSEIEMNAYPNIARPGKLNNKISQIVFNYELISGNRSGTQCDINKDCARVGDLPFEGKISPNVISVSCQTVDSDIEVISAVDAKDCLRQSDSAAKCEVIEDVVNSTTEKRNAWTQTGRIYDEITDRKVNETSFVVYHYWFHNWADHKCPKDVNALLNLSLDVLKRGPSDFDQASENSEELCKCESPKCDSKFVFPPLESVVPCDVKINLTSPLDFTVDVPSPPTIVHCSAGIGRTGCLIAILNGIHQLTNDHKVDVLGIVCSMRLNRGGMVQNSEQYELIHKVLCLFERACLPEL